MVHSLIRLFPEEATDFSTNGLGSLSQATSCTVTEEANGSFELEIVYPIHGIHFKDIAIRKIICVKPNPADPPQAFRIYEYSKPMNGLVTFYASHVSYDLLGYPTKPFTAEGCDQALQALSQNIVVEHPFTFWTDKISGAKVTIDTPVSARNVLGGMEGSILDTFKGEYKFDNFDVRLYDKRGKDNGVTIRYGKNLTDIKQDENCSEVYTAVLPYWFNQEDYTIVMLPEMVLPTKGTYSFTKVLVLDLSSEFQERPLVVELRERAQKYIDDNDLGVPKISIDVSFVQLSDTEEYSELAPLEEVNLFDTVAVSFPELGVSAEAKVSKTVFDVMSGRYSSITLGDIHSTMSQTVAEQQTAIQQVTDSFGTSFATTMAEAIERATNWITNGKGYMVAIKDSETGAWKEICSLDTTDIDTAQNVWRWNNGGFGHSSKGYNGPYTFAITQDGHMVADFVTIGTMLADRIRGGTFELGGKNNGNGTFKWYNNTGNLIGTINKDGIDVDSGEISGVNIYASYFATYGKSQSDSMPGYMIIGDKSVKVAKIGRMYFGEFWYGGEVLDTDESYFLRDGVIGDFSIELDQYSGSSSTKYYDTSAFTLRSRGECMLLAYKDDNVFGSSRKVSSYSFELSSGNIDQYDEGFTFLYPVYFNKDSVNYASINTVSKSEAYSNRLLYSYETTSPLYGDIGEAFLDENGECYLYLDDIFTEAISSFSEYQVFLQKEGEGDLWVSEKNEQYFVVKGTPMLKFAWEIKGKRKGYEIYRLENLDNQIEEADVSSIDYDYIETLKATRIDYEDQYIEEIKQILYDKEVSLYGNIKTA